MILPKLKTMPMRELQRLSGLPRSTLQAIRAGRRPHSKNGRMLRASLAKLAQLTGL